MNIPETFNALTMREAFLFYRDVPKLNVRPLLGPWCADPARAGKAPTIKEYWKRPVMEWDVERHFNGNGRCHNIGLGPREDLVVLDLDSKPDKGASVRNFLALNPGILKGPWHDTANGVHLVFRCKDLPKTEDTIKNGRPCEGVTAELFHAGAIKCNIVLPPSVHADGHIYRWAATGEVVEVSWAWLRETFKFVDPASTDKVVKNFLWFLRFKGDLKSLDIVEMLEHLGRPAKLESEDEGKYSILCPWHEGHGQNGKTGTSTVVWANEEEFPGFKCLHNTCGDKDLRALLEWAEGKEPGVVDRFCKRPRVFMPRYRDEKGRPQILHPDNELISDVYTKLGNIIGPKRDWFMRGDSMVAINEVPSGFVYSNNPDTAYTVEAHTTGFREITSQEARSGLENHVIPGVVDQMSGTFIRKSFSPEFCISMVSSDHLRKKLPLIARVLTVPVPVRVGNALVYPKEGYDERFGTFLVPGAPKIRPMSLKQAIKIIEDIHADFPFTTPQSKCHAIARLITPFLRGLLGWTTRVPLWYYIANRPRAGKDYLAIITLLVYEGYGFEDLPIGREAEETFKRIMAAARSGRHFMHFSNCQGYLQDQYFCQVITNQQIAGRSLGSNSGAADLVLPNEMEFSMSGNVGNTYREDFEGRMRKIELAYYQDNANSRAFKNPFLHEKIKEERSEVVSAVAALTQNWADVGFPVGPTVFTSFPKWAQTAGGVMVPAGFGDPCLPFEGTFDDAGGDLETDAMRALFRVCREKFGDAWKLKKEIYECVHAAMKEGNDALGYFGDIKEGEGARSNQTKLGKKLLRFKGRELSGIVLLIDEKANAQINKYRFVIAPGGCEPVNVCERSDSQCASEDPPKAAGKNREDEGVSLQSSEGLDVHKSSQVHTFDEALSNPEGAPLAIDIETFGENDYDKKGRFKPKKDRLNHRKGKIRLLSVTDEKGQILLRDLLKVPLQKNEGEILEQGTLVAHNANFELRFLSQLGVFPKKIFCTQTAAWLLTPTFAVSHELEHVMKRYLGIEMPNKELGKSDWGASILTEEQIEYSRNDTRHLPALRTKLEEELEKAGLMEVFAMEMALLPIVVRMECNGFPVDSLRMRELREEAVRASASLDAKVLEAFGELELNLNSSQQLKVALANHGIETESTDKKVLATINHPLCKMLVERSEATSYLEGIDKYLSAIHQGKLYSVFNPVGTCTGRFSSKEVNLQQVQRGKIRACFVPSSPEHRLIVIDYSQIELRVAAKVANDEVMIEAFKRKEDLHHKTASAILGREASEEERDKLGKATNFGFLYGQRAKGFVTNTAPKYGLLDVTVEQVEVYRDRHFELYLGLKEWHQKCEALSWDPRNNSARTVFGRLLVAQEVKGAADWQSRKERFDMLTNYVVQGSAADLLKMSLIKADAVLPPTVRLISTLHDEAIYDAPADIAEKCKQDICEVTVKAFVSMFGTDIPVEVEAKVCANWSEKK